MVTRVVVKLRFEGVHAWPACNIEAVAFLRHDHRHEFHVTAAKAVAHEDREVEIVGLKRALETFCRAQFAGPHTMSCETMARRLVEAFGLDRCEVLEDGENGAEVVA